MTEITDIQKPTTTIFISAGHYPQKPGAINQKLRLKEHFEAQKIAVNFNQIIGNIHYTFQVMQPDTLQKKIELINSEVKCDSINSCSPQLSESIAIEIHMNACPTPNTGNGVETLYFQESRRGHLLADCIQNSLLNVLPFSDRGIKGRDDLYFLSATSIPAVIAEVLFINNDKDATYLFYPRAHGLIAGAILTGVETYFKRRGVNRNG